MPRQKVANCIILAVLCFTCISSVASPANPGNDIVTFKNGDTLTGSILRATAATVEFVNSSVGSLTLKWTDIKTLHINHPMSVSSGLAGTSETFNSPVVAVRTSGTVLDLDVGEAGESNTIPLQNVQSLIGLDKCASGIQSACPGWRVDKFKISTAFLASTQRQQTYSGELDIVRNWNPQEDGWPHERTLVQLLPSYDDKKKGNKIGSSNVTRNYQGKLQQLFFITSDDFFGKAIVDLYHNNSLGLYFQQAYGGGLGVIVHDLELNADIRFIGEHFYRPTPTSKPIPSASLVGSQLSERYSFGLDFIRPSTTLTETGIVTPVFNASRSWQAQGLLELNIPITRNWGFVATLSDNYVENAPPAFRKNYLKTTVGLQFTPPKH